MIKKNNQYELNLTELVLKDGRMAEKSLKILVENHDDIFEIIDSIKRKQLFENEGDNTNFAIGLKLFSEVLIKHRNLPLFEDLKIAFGDFIKN